MTSRKNRLSPSGIVANDILNIVDTAEHRNVADRLLAVRSRWRQHADRSKLLDGAALDPAQQHLGVRSSADQQGRRRPFGLGMTADAESRKRRSPARHASRSGSCDGPVAKGASFQWLGPGNSGDSQGHLTPADISSAACVPAIMAGQFHRIPRLRHRLGLEALSHQRRPLRTHTSSPRESRTDAS